MKKLKAKQVLAMLLSIMLITGTVSSSVFAAEAGTYGGTKETGSEEGLEQGSQFEEAAAAEDASGGSADEAAEYSEEDEITNDSKDLEEVTEDSADSSTEDPAGSSSAETAEGSGVDMSEDPSGTDEEECTEDASSGNSSEDTEDTQSGEAVPQMEEEGDPAEGAPVREVIEAGTEEEISSESMGASEVTGLPVAVHSEDEIRAFFRSCPAPFLANTFSEQPSTVEPYDPGVLSEESTAYAFNALNQVRYIAGLDADVTEDPAYTEKAQAAALCNAANNTLSHYPEQPDGMDDTLYQTGLSGAGSSNIAWGTGSLVSSIHLWMSDSDSSNIDRLGHRRWLLNPSMGKTGFGAVNAYSAVYAFDNSGSGTSLSGVAWPAQNMPVEYFEDGDAWSVSFGRSLTADNVQVTVTRTGDGKTWQFSTASADGYFNVENSNYGQKGCVIFQPEDLTCSAGDRFDVSITGALDSTVEYTVSFFSLCDGSHEYEEKRISYPTCTERGKIAKICRTCGDVQYVYEAANGHEDQLVSQQDGLLTMKCSVCGLERTGICPTSFDVYWRKYGSSGYYSSVPPSGFEPGDAAEYLVTDFQYAASADYYFTDLTWESSDPEHCVIDTGNEKITFLEAGTYKVTITSKYNPDASESATFTVVKPLEGVTLEADAASPQTYGETVRLTAVPDGGKGKLSYTFVKIAEDGTETTLQEASTKNWCDIMLPAGSWKLRVDAADSADASLVYSSEIPFEIEKDTVRIKNDSQISAADTLTYGQPLSELTVQNASFEGNKTGEALTGQFSFDEPDEVLPAGTHEAAWTFVPDDANYESLKGSLAVDVKKAVPILEALPEAETAVYHPGRTLDNIALSGGKASVPGTWIWTDGTTVPQVPGGMYDIRFIPADEENYEPVDTQVSLIVGKAVPALRDLSADALTYGQTLSDSALSGSAYVSDTGLEQAEAVIEGTFSWQDGTLAPTVADSDSTSYSVLFTPSDSQNYEPAETYVLITVKKAARPSQMPPVRISVPYSTNALSDKILEDLGAELWGFSPSDLGTLLTAGETAAFTSFYKGDDKGNYETESVQIEVSRSSCQHDGEKSVKNAQAATCEEDGATGDQYCTICGEMICASTTIPATGHSWNDGEVTEEATCVSAGTRIYTCLNDSSHTKTEVIPVDPDNHTGNTEIRNARESACGEEGYTGDIYCKDCGKLLEAGTVIPAKKNVADASIQVPAQTYTGKALTPAPVVTLDDTTLTAGTDYKVLSYADNKNAGTGTVTITGTGNYGGETKASFTINKAAQTVTAKDFASSVAVGRTTTIHGSGTNESPGITYTSSNKNVATVNDSTGVVTAKKVGTVTIKVTAAETANYKDADKDITIKVVPAATTKLTAANLAKGVKMTWKKVTGATGYIIYRNNKKIKTITKGATVTYTDTAANTNGTKYVYKVVAKASTGNSTLSKSVTVYKVARPTVKTLKNTASKKMTATWAKNAKATGYQIQYSTSKTFASGNKSTTITKNSTVSKVIGSLTKGKTYYVRIRTYKTVGKTKYWSAWSAAKSVKISK